MEKEYGFSTRWNKGDKLLTLFELNNQIASKKNPEAFRKIENLYLKFSFQRKMVYIENKNNNKSNKCFSSNPKLTYKFLSVAQNEMREDLALIIQNSNNKRFGE
jgi:hypothetical protein